MWANAQRDGRPAEYRWRPLFNAAVWLTPTTRVPCSNAAKTLVLAHRNKRKVYFRLKTTKDLFTISYIRTQGYATLGRNQVHGTTLCTYRWGIATSKILSSCV